MAFLFSAGLLAALLRLDGSDQTKAIPGLPTQARYDIQGEITVIAQGVPSFRSRHSGPNSFPSGGQLDFTETGTVYLGARPLPNLEVYANPEFAWGNAPGAGSGLAGYSNGDLIGQPVSTGTPYFARAFVRWRIPVRQGKDKAVGREDVGRAPNIIAGPVPQHRLIVTVGKFAVTDIFDVNGYANNARNQFLNNAFVNGLAYDYAEDSRGYDFGASLVLNNPNYSVRFGTFAMPTTPGGDQLSYSSSGGHSEQLEVDLNPQFLKSPKPPLTVRLLGYRNVGNMGRYSDALGSSAGLPPSLAGVRSAGTARTGFGVNLEQAFADGGSTGFFARLGCADGAVETAGYAEADDAFSWGCQIGGVHWKQKADSAGFAAGCSGISSSHQKYLELGGQGFNLGDGALNYGRESTVEMYYLHQATKNVQLTGDVQFIANPGYNRDRGPVSVFSVRARYVF